MRRVGSRDDDDDDDDRICCERKVQYSSNNGKMGVQQVEASVDTFEELAEGMAHA